MAGAALWGVEALKLALNCCVVDWFSAESQHRSLFELPHLLNLPGSLPLHHQESQLPFPQMAILPVKVQKED